MKIKVKDLIPNPYRRMEKYPIDVYKVESLKTSIEETSFWDNVLAREKDGKYEIAYGHHRLIAIQELGIKEVDIPVRDLDNATMVKIMANENMEDWGASPAIVNESVAVAKEFLDAELKKYESWEEARINKSINTLFENAGNFGRCKKKDGVGQTTLLKFLGGNWKQSRIQSALDTILSKDIDRAVVETRKTMSEGEDYKRALRKAKVPKKKQVEVVKKTEPIVKQWEKEEKRQKREARKRGEKVTVEHPAISKRRKIQKAVNMVSGMSEKEAGFKELEQEIERFKERIRAAYVGSRDLNLLLEELDVKKLEGLKSLFVLENVSDLVQELKKTLAFFGFDYKQLQIERR